MEATIIAGLNHMFTALSLITTHIRLHPALMDRNSAAATQTPFTDTPSVLYVRRNRKDRNRKINVFDGNGNLVYTIERTSQFIPMWSIFTAPGRKEIATVHTGLMDRSVDFHNKSDIQHRELVAVNSLYGRVRRFHLTDGAPYEWSRLSHFLERVVNPGGGAEEVRERVARARLMRQFRFDYELLIDTQKIDREVVLATAFINMVTVWGLGHKTRTVGPSYVPKSIAPGANLPLDLIPDHLRDHLRNAADGNDVVESTKSHDEYPSLTTYSGEPTSIENRVVLILDPSDNDAMPTASNRALPAPTAGPSRAIRQAVRALPTLSGGH